MTKTTFTPDGPRAPIPHSVLLVFDPRSGSNISRLDVGSGSAFAGPSTIVWSKDGSRLLACWQDAGLLVAFDIAHGKQLGDYQAHDRTGLLRIRDSVFNEDGLSVTITDENGKTEVWQLP
jgi:WD40 repeat protein